MTKEKRIIERHGKLVLFHDNIPIRVLSEQEAKEVRYKASAQYKAKVLGNVELFISYMTSIRLGNWDDAKVYRAEILRRMDANHK